jgi:dephospho-CoA kinase
VLLIGLTGGIGAGKSTVSAALVDRGARLIDADAVVRELQQPGAPVFDAMVARFGPSIVAPDGSLDRAAVAAVVFSDDAARADLNAIVHPAVGVEIMERVGAASSSDDVVVLDVPLLVEGGRFAVAGVLVVDCPVEVAVQRLVSQRGMDEADARARIAVQATREERLARADHVVDNGGTPEDLAAEIDRAWAWIEGLRAAQEASAGAGAGETVTPPR